MSITVSIPFSPHLSKNLLYGIRKGGKYIKPEAAIAREFLSWAIKKELMKTKVLFKEEKLLLDIFVEKPDNRSDAINLLDSIADVVKTVIGVDDRWYSATIDWCINKTKPTISITISQ